MLRTRLATDLTAVSARAPAAVATISHLIHAALIAKDSAPAERGESLAIPTWFYGSEPSRRLSAYAKFFQNSVREEALITPSRAGIIYAQGAGGTLREIVEDGEQISMP